jgi:alcohol dehydrogenase class IV
VEPFDVRPRTRVLFGQGTFARLGELARERAFRRTLLVADPGLVAAGYVDEAEGLLKEKGVEVVRFHGFDANPDSAMIEAGTAFAREEGIDSLVGLGGGSSMDTAKGINFVLTNGGRIQDYWGYGKATKPMLPMIGVPTTAGTGSEAQSHALISDAATHRKMACGDPGATFAVVILDPVLTLSQPRSVTATTGYDALSHAVESYVTTRRNAYSDMLAREAFRLLDASYERVLAEPDRLDVRGAMQLGAFYAGMAIEHSMLGATHACANPLTARYGTLHGVAIALMLPHVTRWNAPAAEERYRDLLAVAGRSASADGALALAARLDTLATEGGLPRRLRDAGVPRSELLLLARDAATQMTAAFNPRPFDAEAALHLYETAF